MTRTIETHLLSEITRRVEARNKRAAKLGVQGLTLLTGNRRVEERRHEFRAEGETFVYRYKAEVADVEIVGPAVKLAGWTFLATIEHTEAGNVLRQLPGVDTDLPEAFRTAAATCDHCRKDRKRSDTYVVRHDDGRLCRVGKTCLQDFLGASIESLLPTLRLFGGADEDFGRGTRVPTQVDLREFVGVAASLIRTDGYRSRKSVEGTAAQTTGDEAWALILDARYGSGDALRYAQQRLCAITDGDLACAAASIDYARQLDARSDFDHNLKLVATLSAIDARKAGFAAYLPAAFARNEARRAERQLQGAQRAASPSQKQGSVGERIERTLTVVGIISRDGIYGTTHITKFLDASGNKYVWFCSGARLDEGKTYAVRGTVKKFSDFRGETETVLSRCTSTPVTAAQAA